MAAAGSGGGAGRSPRVGFSKPPPSQAGPRAPGSADLRLLEKTLRRLAKLCRQCSDPRLALKNSPPYLPELLGETSALLAAVWQPYAGGAAGGRVPKGDEGVYLKVHIRHLLDKTERAVLLFKEGKDRMFEEGSSYR